MEFMLGIYHSNVSRATLITTAIRSNRSDAAKWVGVDWRVVLSLIGVRALVAASIRIGSVGLVVALIRSLVATCKVRRSAAVIHAVVS